MDKEGIKAESDNGKDLSSLERPMNILDKIKIVNFPENQYFKDETVKKQIYLHHTVSGGSAQGDVDYWLSDTKRIATSIVIDRGGTPLQCFPSKYWGYHLGIEGKVFKKYKIKYQSLDKISIGVEIDSWGGLTFKKKDGKWYSYAGKLVETENVIEYPEGFRGYYAFEKYTDAQIKTLKELLLYWNKEWNIPLTYKEEIWGVYTDALKGVSGVYTHVSVRSDKSDCHPQKNLIEMLKTLSV